MEIFPLPTLQPGGKPPPQRVRAGRRFEWQQGGRRGDAHHPWAVPPLHRIAAASGAFRSRSVIITVASLTRNLLPLNPVWPLINEAIKGGQAVKYDAGCRESAGMLKCFAILVEICTVLIEIPLAECRSFSLNELLLLQYSSFTEQKRKTLTKVVNSC